MKKEQRRTVAVVFRTNRGPKRFPRRGKKRDIDEKTHGSHRKAKKIVQHERNTCGATRCDMDGLYKGNHADRIDEGPNEDRNKLPVACLHENTPLPAANIDPQITGTMGVPVIALA